MYRKYRITLTIIGLLAGFGALMMFLFGGYFLTPTDSRSLIEVIFALSLIILYPIALIAPIVLLMSDLIYIIRKEEISKSLKILDIIMVVSGVIIGVYTYLYITKFEWFINTNEMITYLFLGLNIIIWILQIVFTFKWNKSSKKEMSL